MRASATLSLVLVLVACGGEPEPEVEENLYTAQETLEWECTAQPGMYFQDWNPFYPEGWQQFEVDAPYEVRSVSAELLALADALGDRDCDPGSGVEIAVWASDDYTPGDFNNGTQPMDIPELGSALLAGSVEPTATATTERVTAQLDRSVEVLEGQRLFIGYRLLNSSGAGAAACVAACGSDVEQTYWQHNPDSTTGEHVVEVNRTLQMMVGATLGVP